MWNYEGKWIKVTYLNEFTVSGFVESSRVSYGGGVLHTIVLDKPLNMRWRNEAATRLIVKHENILQVKG